MIPSQVHSALAYYFDHQDEVEADMAISSDMDYWKKRVMGCSSQD